MGTRKSICFILILLLALPVFQFAQKTPTKKAVKTQIKKVKNQKTDRSLKDQIPTTPTDTYYIWTYDNKLLAEYDGLGNCTREYIYAGNKLIAEYRPQNPEGDRYFYYTTDQINSTRVLTNNSGQVVHSAAYSPYGKTMKTWVNHMDPNRKFSGKEREKYSGMDYFGARYYNNQFYRFLTVDPIMNKKAAMTNPQAWNLYSYCYNNPTTSIDPDGRDVILLNTNTQDYGDSHTAVLIGNDKHGWKFFSRQGETGRILGGRDQNVLQKFDTLADFEKSRFNTEYPHRIHMKTTRKQDFKMLVKAKELMTVEYGPSFELTPTGYKRMNCADYTFEILRAAGIKVEKSPTDSGMDNWDGFFRTSPQEQFDYVKKHNKHE